jgi:shikimate dehydrogenase
MSRDITAQTLIAGVVGDPVRHSLSPVIHNAWIEAAGLDAVYLALPATADSFASLVRGLAGGAALGVNVTIPFKEPAAALADVRSPAVERAGAANLLVFRDGQVRADNTDGLGLLEALGQAGFNPDAGPVVVLGAGGAARGAVAALLAAGAPSVRLVNRSVERAKAIAAGDGRVMVCGWGEAAQALDGAAAVINATSLGMAGQPPLQLSLETAPRGAVIMDMVYRPLRTGLLREAERLGLPSADGLAMLIGQTRPCFEALFGRPAPDVDVRGLCEQALGAS